MYGIGKDPGKLVDHGKGAKGSLKENRFASDSPGERSRENNAMGNHFKHALNSPQAEYWQIAIDKELSGLLALDTWSYVRTCDLPAGSNVMNCHYIFTVKRKADGSIDKFKARLVADGNTQKYGIDYDRIFATVVKSLTIRLVLIIAAA